MGSNVVYTVVDERSFPTWNAHFITPPFGETSAAGYNNYLSSRLVNRTVLENQTNYFRQQLIAMSTTSIHGSYSSSLVIGHLIAGKGVAAQIGGLNGVNPGLLKSVLYKIT